MFHQTVKMLAALNGYIWGLWYRWFSSKTLIMHRFIDFLDRLLIFFEKSRFFFWPLLVSLFIFWYFDIMPLSLSDTLREIISLKFDRGDFNKAIVNSTEVNIRQMQRMRFSWKYSDQVNSFILIGHQFQKLTQSWNQVLELFGSLTPCIFSWDCMICLKRVQNFCKWLNH